MTFSSGFVTVLEKEYFVYSLFTSGRIDAVRQGLTVLVLSYCDSIKCMIIYDWILSKGSWKKKKKMKMFTIKSHKVKVESNKLYKSNYVVSDLWLSRKAF